MTGEIRGLAQGNRSLEEAGAADRRNRHLKQAVRAQARPTAEAIANGAVHALPQQVDRTLGGAQPKLDIGMLELESPEAIDQPVAGDGRRGADHQ